MAIIKCKMCGGSLEVTPGTTVAECEYCGTKQTLPKVNDEVIQNLFNRANNLRLKCEFDKAMQIYEKIVEQDDSEAEAHWGIVLCKYGIEYVEDPKTFKRIPTCHRTLFEAVTTDADYLAAVDYSDTAQQTIYESEARAIDRIQKDILAIVKNEKPFDVFICYKETDENGKRTVDSALANDIYHQLTQEGMKVFYAAITLEDKLGQEYEPYIFAALNSAKVMLVIGTKPEYFSAVWVKNEWSRFMKLMKTDRSKLLIPCYRDMDAYDLPEEFAHLQAQDMSKIGFVNDVVRGIKKLAQAEAPKQTVVQETVVTAANTNTAPLLKRAFMFLEDGDWSAANEYCEKVLDIDPECAEAYLGKLMAELRVKKQEDLRDCAKPFDSKNNYQKAIRFGDSKLKAELVSCIEHINTRNENTRLEGIYKAAKDKMTSAENAKLIVTKEECYNEAMCLFGTILEYKDAAILEQECCENAEIARKDAILLNGNIQAAAGNVSNYEEAIKLYESIPGWKDADNKAETCKKKIAEIKEKEEADRLERERKAEADRLERERKAEIERKEKERKAKKREKIYFIVIYTVAAAILIYFLITVLILPNVKYNKAVSLMEAGQYTEAIAIFEKLGGYKDSVEQAKTGLLKSTKAGDCVVFGAYEQDNNTSNGKENIEWLVLEVKDGKILVISKYALDCQQYNTSYTNVTWETCTLRKWLNNDFINAAFSADEKAMIPTVTVTADKNPEHRTNSGNATQDQVFLLSITEANKYFSSDSARRCEPTDYAVANGVRETDSGNCWWWLRSPGYLQDNAADVRYFGDVIDVGTSVDDIDTAVRPALWIDIGSLD